MKSPNSRNSSRRSDRGPRRSSRGPREDARTARPPVKLTLWQKIAGWFKGAPKSNGSTRSAAAGANATSAFKTQRRPEAVEVTSPKLYVGNLSFDAAESDLHELFSGVGVVRNAEIVTHRDTEKSKGFGFVLMTTIDEAKRAVTELHDRDFLGRKLVVSGAKTTDRETNYRG